MAGLGDLFGSALGSLGSGLGSLFGGAAGGAATGGAPSVPQILNASSQATGGGGGLGDLFGGISGSSLLGGLGLGLNTLNQFQQNQAVSDAAGAGQANSEAALAENARQFDINNQLARDRLAASSGAAASSAGAQQAIAKAQLQQRAAEAAINAALTGRQAEANALSNIASLIQSGLSVGGPV